MGILIHSIVPDDADWSGLHYFSIITTVITFIEIR